MNAITVLVADDHTIFREGLVNLLAKEPQIEVNGEAENGAALLDLLTTKKADVAVLDLAMPGKNGFETLEELKKKHKDVRTLVLTTYNDYEHFKQVKKRGVDGYVLKEDAYDELVKGIIAVSKGEKFVSVSMQEHLDSRNGEDEEVQPDPMIEVLTKTELKVLKLVSKEHSNKEIAEILGISVRTVETHRARIGKKIHAKNTASLVKFAYDHGLMEE